MTPNDTTEHVIPHSDVVVQAIAGTLSAACGIELTEVPEETGKADGMVIAVISLVGDIDWSVFFGLPRDTAVSLSAKFAGFDIPFDSADMGDVVGEITNVFAGRVKAILDVRQINTDISLPSVMRASSMEVLTQHNTASFRAYFDSPCGKLWTGVIAGDSGFMA